MNLHSLIFFYFCRSEEDNEDSAGFMYGEQSRVSGPPLYPHNTYHGFNHHQRTPLAQSTFKPLKFTDSHYPPLGVRNATDDDDPTTRQNDEEVGRHKKETLKSLD